MAVIMAETSYGQFNDYRSTSCDIAMRDTDYDSANDKFSDSTIHSGHYMVSCLDEPDGDVDSADPSDGNIETEEAKGYDFNTAIKEPTRSYRFGSKDPNSSAIDASLTKLFDCMTLAYSGKLTSPKWKNFKGIRLNIKDKIRLNNIIWREWHMQYIQFRKPIICQFEPPISDKTHTKPEAVVMEGKYWKRRMQSVTTEYKKWRHYFKKRSSEPPTTFEDDLLMQEVITQTEDKSTSNRLTPQLFPDNSCMADEDLYMDLSDTLFSSLNQPFAFPNPKEISQLGNADIIQPGLVQLQPSLEDFMDTLEPLSSLQDILLQRPCSSYQTNPSPMVVDGANRLNTPELSTPRHSPIAVDFQAPAFQPSNLYQTGSVSLADSLVSVPCTFPSFIRPATSSTFKAAPSVNTVTNPNSIINFILGTSSDIAPALQQQQQPVNVKPQPTMFVQSSPSPPSTQPPQTVQQLLAAAAAKKRQSPRPQTQPLAKQQPQQPQQATTVQDANGKTVTIIPNNSQLAALLEGLGMPQLAAAAAISQPPIVTLPSKSGTRSHGNLQEQLQKEENRRASTGSVNHYNVDGNFRIPQMPVQKTIKPRIIAPALPVESNAAMPTQKTVLAHLLTQGSQVTSFSTGNFTLKQEPAMMTSAPKPSSPLAFSHIQSPFSSYTPPSTATTNVTFSLPTSTSVCMQTTSRSSSVSDFQKNLLIAAASSAVGRPTIELEEATSSALRDFGFGGTGSPGSPSFHIVNSPISDCEDRSRHTSNDSGGSNTIWEESPQRSRGDGERPVVREHRKASHISAEQKRRCNIKVGFDTLHQLVPSLSVNANSKVSKATTLSKAAEYAQKLKEDRDKTQKEMEMLRLQVESLNNSISICQSQLPATGVPVTRQRVDQMREMFDNYVKSRTLSNWKFWIFSIIIQQLFDSYNSTVSTTSVDELCRTVLAWLEQNCSLVSLRPAVLTSLRQLSTSTSILSDPSKVPEQATKAVTQRERSRHPSAPPL